MPALTCRGDADPTRSATAPPSPTRTVHKRGTSVRRRRQRSTGIQASADGAASPCGTNGSLDVCLSQFHAPSWRTRRSHHSPRWRVGRSQQGRRAPRSRRHCGASGGGSVLHGACPSLQLAPLEFYLSGARPLRRYSSGFDFFALPSSIRCPSVSSTSIFQRLSAEKTPHPVCDGRSHDGGKQLPACRAPHTLA